ncbi:MAG: hypothetical protein LAT83_09245 [Kiritimatiellae bacterium]|nr:hypothetical protein [Kiritimatiellia bacterium]
MKFHVFWVLGLLLPAIGYTQLSVTTLMAMETIEEDTRGRTESAMQMVGPRNGSATAVVLVRSESGSLENLQATLSPVLNESNPDANLASLFEIHFATRKRDLGPHPGDAQSPHFDALSPERVDEGAFQPLVLHVPIPADTPPGRYQGQLNLSANGHQAAIDFQLQVAEFVVPENQDRLGWVDLMQSPDSVAYRYGVPLYSPEHLKLLEPSMRMLGQLGQRTLMIHPIAETHFGNDESMIPAEGDQVDFSGLDGYMRLFHEHVGAPHFVLLYAQEPDHNNGIPKFTPPGGERDGRTEAVTSGYESHENTWRIMLEGIQSRMENLGWTESEMILGWVGDNRAYGDVVKFFESLVPGIGWVQFTHARGDPPPRDGALIVAGMRVAMRILPYAPRGRDLAAGGWDNPFPELTSVRNNILEDHPPANFRRLAPYSTRRTNRAFRGFSRIGLDYWPVSIPNGGEGQLLGRFARWHNLQRANPRALVAPGPKGALPTLRYLNLWEGIQENEARLLIEKAIAEEKLEGEALENAQAVLESWREAFGMQDDTQEIPADFLERVARLYETAASLQ